MVSLLSVALGGAIGFLSGVFATPIRDWIYRPRLELSFSGKEDCVSETLESREIGPNLSDHWQAIYLRVRVQNKRKELLNHA